MYNYENIAPTELNSIDPFYSQENSRLPVMELVERLCEYDVISFDVFGTLIMRPFTSPRVLFSIMEEKLGIYKFSKIRVDSENEVRTEKNRKYSHDNVTIDEIYHLISHKTNLDPKKTAQLEYELEKHYCIANQYMKEIVDLCVASKKKIVICSDMYLSSQQIAELLKINKYPYFENVYVSSELNKSKKYGDLFHYLKQVYQGKKIIHVGDNYDSDVKNALEAGLDSYYYRNVNDIGGRTRIPNMSYITSRVYSAIVNRHLYTSNNMYSEAYKLGFIYGGIYVLGFVQWINNFVNDLDIDKILFLSRDGDVYSKMYDLLPCHKQWEYFYWSRLAGMKITALENFYEFCQRMIWHKSRGLYNIKIEHLLEFFDIDELIYKLKEYSLTRDTLLTTTTAPIVEKLFYDNKTFIIDAFRKDIVATFDAVRNAVGNSKQIAIVDVGWAGTGPLIIKKIINKYLNLECKVYALLAGYKQPIDNMAALYTMDKTIHSYLFSSNLNRDLMDIHINMGTKKNNLLLEIFTQSCTPSFLGYTSHGLSFDREEKENYSLIRDITKGVTDFVKQYIEFFSRDSFILNISAYDAYLPFNELKNSSKRMDSILAKLIIARGKLYDADDVSEETWLSFLYKNE
ncbi:HAD-IA family hydrolase [Selenomonas sp. AB3002]|uniref:HAD-IA family hydrolase n=1 Tax=Selenomonas sp. AB3002 TaxID=1392502 RepID=UPI0004954271